MDPALVALWVALAVFVLAVGGAAAFAGVRGLALWRDVRRSGRVLSAGSEILGARAEQAARKAGGADVGAERLAAATEQLSRSVAYARVIADAAGDVRATLTALRGSVPRK